MVSFRPATRVPRYLLPQSPRQSPLPPKQHLPSDPLRDRIHVLRLLICLLLSQAVIELHQQALSKRLASPVDAPIVEDLGMLPADPHC